SEKTGTANIARWGTGALNIDGCRVPTDEALQGGAGGLLSHVRDGKPLPGAGTFKASELGRWPANLIHDGSDEVVAIFPAEAGAFAPVRGTEPSSASKSVFGQINRHAENAYHGDTGSAARFFYCAKASRKDRNEGCEHMEARPLHWSKGDANPGSFQSDGTDKTSQNHHPTVKPTALMAYLLRLVTPPGGVSLDPYMGSGSTGKAAMREGFRFIGCELLEDHIAIAEARIRHEWSKSLPPDPIPLPAQRDMFGGAA
ncbi:MAG: site-specific DNA-methyltransferase, partial [Armatimonadia bacterium]